MSISPSKGFLKLVMDEDNPAPCTSEDAELFFPNYGGSDEFKIFLAKKVCRKCPTDTKTACLEFALETGDQFAIMGGTDPAQRDRIRQRRADIERRNAA